MYLSNNLNSKRPIKASNRYLIVNDHFKYYYLADGDVLNAKIIDRVVILPGLEIITYIPSNEKQILLNQVVKLETPQQFILYKTEGYIMYAKNYYMFFIIDTLGNFICEYPYTIFTNMTIYYYKIKTNNRRNYLKLYLEKTGFPMTDEILDIII
jgi:hypothetical protein